jgi:hypothetical protein
MLSCLRAGTISEGLFCGDKGTGGYEMAAGVGASVASDNREVAPEQGAR